MAIQRAHNPLAVGTLSADEQRLIDRWIERDPGRPSLGEVRVQEYGIHVWALIGAYLHSDDDIAGTAAAYDIEPEAVSAAVAFYKRYKPAIDARLDENGYWDDEDAPLSW